MPCFYPLKGYRSRELSKNGKRPIVFNSKEGFLDMPVEIACGQCRGCRLERSRQWAVRCVHEASQYERNCFITLTYDEENVPKDGSLRLEDFQLFIKKLRKKEGSGIRYFHCGEYGEALGRPHYHACLFNYDFPDRKLFKLSNGNRLYNSDLAQSFWDNKGFCVIGNVTWNSAAYVARYIMKKVTGDLAEDHYNGKKPEYITMSRRPGLGKAYYDKYHREMYRDDFIIVNGKKVRIPSYYDGQYELNDPDGIQDVKVFRQIAGEKHSANNTPERLRVREKIQAAREGSLLRGLHEN